MTVIFNKKNIKQASASHKNSYLRLIYFFFLVTTKSACGSIALIQQHVNSSISEEDQLKFDVDTVTYYRLIAKLAFILKSQSRLGGSCSTVTLQGARTPGWFAQSSTQPQAP